MKKILIADDEAANIELLKVVLESKNYEVVSAQDGLEAIDVVKKENPDLVLLDIMLPRMDGYKVCSLIKNDIRYKDTIVVFLSCRAKDDEDQDLLKEVKVDDYLIKPCDMEALFEKIEELLAKKNK